MIGGSLPALGLLIGCAVDPSPPANAPISSPSAMSPPTTLGLRPSVVTAPIDHRAPTPFTLPFDWPVVFQPRTPAPGEVVRVLYRGALADAEQLEIRYGFDGWSERSAPADAERRADTDVGLVYQLTKPMIPAASGHEISIELPEHARALHFDVGDPATGARDDRDGREYHLGLFFPFVGPYLGWSETARPEDGIVVHFETSSLAPAAVVWWGDDGIERRVEDDSGDTLHHIELTGLGPGRTFSYRVEDGHGRVSETFRFRTATQDDDAFTFLVAADMQDGGTSTARWSEAAELMAEQHEEARFVFSPGDLTYNDYPGGWWTYFDGGRPLLATRAVIPIIGNHDSPDKKSNPDAASFTRLFAPPTEERPRQYYAVDYGRTRLYALDTEVIEDFTPGSAQVEWLDVALDESADTSRFDWVFAGFHHPVYDAGERFVDEQLLYRPTSALFDGRVDQVFSGHTHLAQRFVPLRFDGVSAPSGRFGRGPNDGVGYTVVPSLQSRVSDALVSPDAEGAEHRALLAFPELEADQLQTDVENGWVEVVVDPARLVVRAWGIGLSGDEREPSVRHEFTHER